MSVDPCPHYPSPAVLGRGVVVGPDRPAPPGTPPGALRVVVDDRAVATPSALVARLHLAWVRREPVVVELVADNAVLRRPEVVEAAPESLPHGFTFERERLHFLLWANNYDARSGAPIWWHGELARRRGGGSTPHADVVVDETIAWADGGPRGPVHGLGDGSDAGGDVAGIVHRESIARGRPRLLGTAPSRDELAPDQSAAVAHAAGAARIIAPAGSGKTRVLTARMRHLLTDRGYEPALVTALAYNTRAAAEMRERLVRADATGARDTRGRTAAGTDGNVTGVATRRTVNVRTFHSLGKRICDLDGRRDVIDEGQQRSILDRLVRTARIPNTDPFQAYLDALGLVRLGLVDPLTAGLLFEVDDFDETFRRYRAELDRRGLLDFDEMIYRACILLLRRPDLRAQATTWGTHLLVDEFQDLTPAFHLLMRLVAGPSLQVFGVGDDDQVIYGYAGADPDYLIDFAADFPGAGDHPLEVNYRCPPAVVDQVVTLLGHNQRRVDKDVRAGRAGAADGGRGDPAVHAVAAGAMAARTVALIDDRLDNGARPPDVAVLARVNATLLPVQVSLAMDGIPHTKVLDAGVLQRTGIRTALAYLRLGLDPERMQRNDVFETINRPARKVKSAVSDHLRGQRFSMTQLRDVNRVLSATHAGRWTDYLDDVQALSDAITDGADTATCLHVIRTRVGLGEAMDTLDASRSRPEGSSHGDDLDALAQLALLQPDPATFGPWLREQLLLPGDDGGDEGGVTLSTVHRVKGMEWDHVVVYAATDGLLPHRLAEDVEEERRVFHVAVTRCRESVAVVGDRTALSPFVAELSRPASGSDSPDDGEVVRREPRVVDGRVTADPGVVVTAPGGVEVEVTGLERTPTGQRVAVVVDGARAHLPLESEVDVGGDRARLIRPTRPGANTRARPGEAGDGSGSRLDAHRQRRLDRLAGSGPASDEPDELTPEAEQRFQALRSWRTDQARDQGMPPYIIFNDRTLKAIAAAAPTSQAELARCHGVGATKLDRYGDDVLALVEPLA